MTNDKQVHVAIDLLLGSLVSDRGFPDANIEDVITIPIYKDKDDFHLEQPFTTIGELNSLRRIRRAHIESSNIIEKVKIKNIKTLQDVEVDLSLLSIIAGINSAGKSSLIESIAVLPRYLDQDFDEMSIPLGDDKFNLGNFRNILSYDTPEDEGASIKLTYKNINLEESHLPPILGQLHVEYTFDDQERLIKSDYINEERNADIKKLKFLPIKEIKVSINQIGFSEDVHGERQSFQPINAEYKINKERFNDQAHLNSSILFGSFMESMRDEYKEIRDWKKISDSPLFNSKIEKSFSCSLATSYELEQNIKTNIKLFGVNYDHRELKISPSSRIFVKHEIPEEMRPPSGVLLDNDAVILDGYMSININKYLNLLSLDNISENVDRSKINISKLTKEQINIFKQLVKWVCDDHKDDHNLSEEKIYETILSVYSFETDSLRDFYPEVIESAEWQIGKSIIKVANYILGVSINDDPNIARELEEEEKIQYFLHGILDYVEISSRGEHLLVHNLINKIKEVESHPEIWINDWFDNSISAEEIIKIIEKNIEKRKNLMTWAGVSEDYLKYYDEQLGDYANFIIDTKKETSDRSINIRRAISENKEDKKDAGEIYKDFNLEIKKKLREHNIKIPFITRWHTNISRKDNAYTKRDLILMYLSEIDHDHDNLLIPLLRKDIQEPHNIIKDAIRKLNSPYASGHFSDIELFEHVKNISTVQFLGPLRDRGEDVPIFYRHEKPFTLGKAGEYSAVYLKDNAEKRGKFLTPDIFNQKTIDLINKKVEKLNKEGINSIHTVNFHIDEYLEKDLKIYKEMSLIDHLSSWGEYMGICKKFVINDDGDVPVIFVEDFEGKQVDIVSVGVGISQVLPVLLILSIPSFDLIDRGVLSQTILEQPELHLHPAAQAKLADFLVASSRSGHIIVETHSEYTVSRIRYRFAQLNSIFQDKHSDNNDHMSIYFASKNKDNETIFEQIKINEKGGLNEYPAGFFDQAQIQAMDFLDLSKKQEK
tara:strand:- start:319 stop:3315 length:2997 start_codon:yes stop_codon:yes gene_type:complete